jgi:hypothetical protein
MADKGNGKAVSRSPDPPLQQAQEGTLSLEELAAFGITPEEYQQDQLARQSIAQNAWDEIWSASSATIYKSSNSTIQSQDPSGKL